MAKKGGIDLIGLAQKIVSTAKLPSVDGSIGELRRVGLVYIVELAAPAATRSTPRQRVAQLADARGVLERDFKKLPFGKMLRARGRVGRPPHHLYAITPLCPALENVPEAQAELGRFLVVRIPGCSFDDLDSFLAPLGFNSYDLGYLLRDELNQLSTSRAGQKNPIKKIAPDRPFKSLTCHPPPPGTPQNGYDWPICAMGLQSAWKKSQKGISPYARNVLVGHLDTGYSDHQAVRGPRLLTGDGDDPIDDQTDARDPLVTTLTNSEPGHGTSTASLIMSASSSNPEAPVDSLGLIGVATRADLVPIRVCDSTAYLWNFYVADGLGAAIKRDCKVVSMSIGGLWTPGFEHLARYAYKNNILLIAAAGNCVYDVVFPARYNECLAVGASRQDCKYWCHAPDHPKVAIAAPGDNVRTTCIIPRVPVPAGDTYIRTNLYLYNFGSGTSFSTAFAAGAAALWRGFYGEKKISNRVGTPLQDVFTKAVRNTATVPASGWDTTLHGAGIINIDRLLDVGPSPLGRSSGKRLSEVDSARSLLEFLGSSITRRSDSSQSMLETARQWFSSANDAAALRRIDEFGGEMINLLLEHGDKIYSLSNDGPVGVTTNQFNRFFLNYGSHALKEALSSRRK